ncbi:hypothetical protein BG011_003671 [Mortierella polycephala]|uniref:Uncharacterized protein n=1 Tax=Mortierella polycephala TaxID=41804 RepID=A0A9P6Q0E8_9FUNG|nr:hypothetical protein BG011_003671 [Mortierella polycephala]
MNPGQDFLASVPGIRDLPVATLQNNELAPQGSPHSLSTLASSFSSSGSLPIHQQQTSGDSVLGLIHRSHNVDNGLHSGSRSQGHSRNHSRTQSTNGHQSLGMNSRTPSESSSQQQYQQLHQQQYQPQYQQNIQSESMVSTITALSGNISVRTNISFLPESQGSTFLSSPNETTDGQGGPDSPVGAIPSNWGSPLLRPQGHPIVSTSMSSNGGGLASPPNLCQSSLNTQPPHLSITQHQQQPQKSKKDKHTFGGMSASSFLTETLPATGMKLYPGSKKGAKSHGDVSSASSSSQYNSSSNGKSKKQGSGGGGGGPLSSINTRKQQLSPGGHASASMERSYSSSTNNISGPMTGSVAPHHLHMTSPTFSKNQHSSLDAMVMAREMAQSHATEDVWQALCIKVLTLFNGQGLTGAIEDLNDLVRRCLQTRTPFMLCDEINELLKNGMLTLNAKLGDVRDDKLVSRLVEVWSFFFGTVLPYFEGVFLPLQIELKTCHAKKMTRRTPSGHGNGAGSGSFTLNTGLNGGGSGGLNAIGSGSTDGISSMAGGMTAASPKSASLTDTERNYEDSEPENVRTMALTGFRDLVILPMVDRLGDVFAKLLVDFDASIPVKDTAPRMLQMTSVLTSIQSGDQHQLLMESVSDRLKTNWKQFTRRGNRGGFIGLEKKIAPAQQQQPQ